MLTLKDLDNRVYSDKTCSEFSYSLKDERDKPSLKPKYNFALGNVLKGM